MFMTSSIIQELLEIKIQLNMSKQEKKRQRVNVLLKAETKLKKNSKITEPSSWPLSSTDLNPHNYTKCYVLESKTNASSNLNFGSLKSAIEEEWNRISEKIF